VALSATQKSPSSILAPILRDTFFDGEGLPRLLGVPVIDALAVAMLLFAGFLQIKHSWGRELGSWADRRREQRHGRRTKGPELDSAFSLKRAGKEDGIRFQLRWVEGIPALGQAASLRADLPCPAPSGV
jgi:hypothetical protein